MEECKVRRHIHQVVCVWVIFLTSCLRSNALSSTRIPETPTDTHPVQTQAALTATPTSSETITETPAPTPTLRPTRTPSPTPTPLPTLNDEAALQEIRRLMATNNNCSGPCFWGITPGKTSFDEAVRFLKTLNEREVGEDSDGAKFYRDCFVYQSDLVAGCFFLQETKGEIKRIEISVDGLELPGVSGQDWLAFRPDHFLEANGVPEEVKVIMSESLGGRVRFSLRFLYQDMYIGYSGNQVIIKPENILRACPNADHNIQGFDLWLGEYEEQFQKLQKQGLFPAGIDLNQVTTLTVEEFYQLMLGDPETACFDLNYRTYLAEQADSDN